MARIGKFGPVQKHGGIHYGDVLFAVSVKILKQSNDAPQGQ